MMNEILGHVPSRKPLWVYDISNFLPPPVLPLAAIGFHVCLCASNTEPRQAFKVVKLQGSQCPQLCLIWIKLFVARSARQTNWVFFIFISFSKGEPQYRSSAKAKVRLYSRIVELKLRCYIDNCFQKQKYYFDRNFTPHWLLAL